MTLTCDASKQGLGAACLQNGQPVAFASRVLAPNEQKWAQIEKELLAIVFACKKFNDYIYGKEVIIESDHKPLETIFKKQLEKAPARLQNMLLKLQKYNIKVVYKKGKEMYLADTLSRAYPSGTKDVFVEKVAHHSLIGHSGEIGTVKLVDGLRDFGGFFWHEGAIQLFPQQ